MSNTQIVARTTDEKDVLSAVSRKLATLVELTTDTDDPLENVGGLHLMLCDLQDDLESIDAPFKRKLDALAEMTGQTEFPLENVSGLHLLLAALHDDIAQAA